MLEGKHKNILSFDLRSLANRAGKIKQTYSYNPVFFILLAEKSFEILPKHNGAAFIHNFLL